MICYIATTNTLQKQGQYKIGETINSLNDRTVGSQAFQPEKIKEIYSFDLAEGISDKKIHKELISIGIEHIEKNGGVEWFVFQSPKQAIAVVKAAHERILLGSQSAINPSTNFVNFWDPIEGFGAAPPIIVFNRISHLRQTKFNDRGPEHFNSLQNQDTPYRTVSKLMNAVSNMISSGNKTFLVWFNLEVVWALHAIGKIEKKNITLFTWCPKKASIAKKYGVNVLRSLDDIG